MLKFNPDSHWSAAFYNGLNFLQHKDGCNIVNLNHDDAVGFTMATHHLHKSPIVEGHETITKYTDYVNLYASILWTKSYHFWPRKPQERCVLEWLNLPVFTQKIPTPT